ncbi:hypothetical protein F5148DRAFT_1290484 [Russula earlei]|uniref:Uncharacterized protein n=1 Tax=Russula earlei TaxID=71964 RepID=A0ACC0TXZ2_9AGAM|nr:hypothetical protein F5148DRAFT_1290484 [Russula earlei]
MLRMQTGVIKSLLLLCILWCNTEAVCAQIKLGSNTVGTTRSAILDLNSANQGLLLPRITDTSATTGVSKYSPPDGMFIFFNTDKSLRIRKNGSWIKVIDSLNALQADWNQASTTALDYIKNKPTITNGTVTSIGLSSTDFTVSGSPVTTSGIITANLNTSGVTAGSYSTVTVNNKGIVTAGTNRSFSIVARTLGTSPTSFQPSTTRDAQVVYTVTINAVATLISGQAGTVFLEYSPNNSTWTTIGQVTHNIVTGLILNISETMQVSGYIPAGYFVRLRTSGAATITYVTGQEMLY